MPAGGEGGRHTEVEEGRLPTEGEEQRAMEAERVTVAVACGVVLRVL